jgi:hypothetical protein
MKLTDEAVDTAIHTYYDATPEPTDHQLAAVRLRVLSTDAPPVRRRRRLRLLPGLGVAAVGVLVIALGAYLLPSGTDPAADPGTGVVPGTAAGAELELVAARTDRAQPLAVTGQQVVYTRLKEQTINTVMGSSGDAMYSATRLTESWAPANGLQVAQINQTDGIDAEPLTKADEARLAAYGADYRKVRTGPVSVEKGPAAGPPAGPAAGNWTYPTKEYLASLPTDPTTLLAMLRSEIVKSYGDPGAKSSKPSTDQRTFQAVVDLVSRADALLTPAVRSALYRAIGQLPGVVRSPGQVDLNGRTGIAFTHPMPNGLSVQLIISPDTTRALGVREVATAPVQVNGRDPLPTGTVLTSSSTEQYVVDSIGAKP